MGYDGPHKISPVLPLPDLTRRKSSAATVVPIRTNAIEAFAEPSTTTTSAAVGANASSTGPTHASTSTTAGSPQQPENPPRRRSGSKIKGLNLFSQDDDGGLDLDLEAYYKARALQQSVRNLHLAFDRVQTSSVIESRGLRMALSPEEEFAYHQKLQRVAAPQPPLVEQEDDEENDDDDDDLSDEEEDDQMPDKDNRIQSMRRSSETRTKALHRSKGATGSSPALSVLREKSASARSVRASSRTLDDMAISNREGINKLFKNRDKDRTKAKKVSEPKVYTEDVKPFGMINPHGRHRLAWDLLSICFIFYNAIVLPFRASFLTGGGNDSSFERGLDFFFVIDIITNFNTGIEVEGSIKYKRKLIADAYFRSWFCVDLIAAIPYGMFFPSNSSDSNLLNTLRLLRLVRLLRLLRISRILERIQNAVFIRSTMSSLLKYVFLVMCVAHWFSCVFHAIGQAKIQQHEPNWIEASNLQDPLGDSMDRYIAALYFSVMTLATIGYGDVSGRSADERLFSIFAMIIGGGIFAYGITNIVELVSSLTIQESRFREKMDEVNEYMRARELPLHLRVEIREFYYNMRSSSESKLNCEQQILNSLTSKLRSKIALSINDHFLRKFPFFEGSDPNFLMEVALNMRTIHFAPLEDVIVEGEVGFEMFFIFRGAVEVLKQNKQIGIMGENQYFGELAILNTDNRRTATVRTLCFCELRMLSRSRFMMALQRYPMMQKRLEEEAKGRGYQHQLTTDTHWRAGGLDGANSLAARETARPALIRGTSGRMSRSEATMSEHESSISMSRKGSSAISSGRDFLTSGTISPARSRSRLLSVVSREAAVTNTVMAQGINDTHRLTSEMQHKNDTMAARLQRLESAIDQLLKY